MAFKAASVQKTDIFMPWKIVSFVEVSEERTAWT
jgi:hypothetical protein